jgi:cell division protein FtsZ
MKQMKRPEDMITFEEEHTSRASIKVIGIGGGGGNAINRMIEDRIAGVDFIAANTDAQALRASHASMKLQLGSALTKGLGAGSNPDRGRDAALEDEDRIREYLGDCDMVFITAGMGGGTGTGGAPVIARIARDLGALTVAVVTKPFEFEGKIRRRQAERGIEELREAVDTLITIPNQRLLEIVEKKESLMSAFRKADEVLRNAVQGISDLITVPGLINLDFADVRTVMANMGIALMGTGIAEGEGRAAAAATAAIRSPLLEDTTVDGAKGILINISAASDLTLMEVSEAAHIIEEAADDEAHIIFGAVLDDSLGPAMKVTVIATGFDQKPTSAAAASAAQAKRQPRKTAAHAAPAPEPVAAEPAAAAARGPAEGRRPVVDLGDYGNKRNPGEVPGVVRRKRAEAPVQEGTEPDYQNLEIPTFLRRSYD